MENLLNSKSFILLGFLFYFFFFKVALLSGPPGLGKTTLAHVIAKHAGYNVVEINARWALADNDDEQSQHFCPVVNSGAAARVLTVTTAAPTCSRNASTQRLR